ncbi:MAG: YbaB/EbfC family nucleoid-associated protein [Gammaproteobacteria bacterium]|nr:YbaB/EbfC family nucleoid-associated protein [Gammaproteobacteria bacterium]
MKKGGMNQLMQQAQQMQSRLEEGQKELANMEVTGEAGGGLISVLMTCRHDVRRVTIDPGLLDDDREMLEDLIAAAVNDAVRKVEKTTQEHMSGLMGGMGLPGGSLPF